jgi:phenylalanyl-tRNA synthetase beta chain
MLVVMNTSWLLEYLEPGCSVDEIIKCINGIGLEIEERHDLAQELGDVRIGFIRGKAPLPGADGMYICQCEITPGEILEVVCASEHPINVGWGVPIVRAGTQLPTGIEVKRERFHGQLSEGMICLDRELGTLQQGTGLQVFPDEGVIGQRLVDLISIPDSLLKIKVPANRAYCLGVIGIAREIAAALGLQVRLPSATLEESERSVLKEAQVEIEAPDVCPRYAARVIRGVKIAKSPPWLATRLALTGVNLINNVVDVTNFVLREWGHPLHAFDLHRLTGRQIVVRRMRPDERLTLLGDELVTGETTPLVIADKVRPIALAGIKGGLETQITAETEDVLLESAHFDPVEIRSAARRLEGRLKLPTDASFLFERGMDPNDTLVAALDRAAALITQFAGGSVSRGRLDAYPVKQEPRVFHLSAERVSSYLGISVNGPRVQQLLTRLGMECTNDLTVKVPTWRVDVNDPVVLIEDVARLVGYDQIPLAPSTCRMTLGKRNAADNLRQKAAQFFVANGFLECRNVPLEAPEMTAQFNYSGKAPVLLRNPMKAEFSVLRTSLLTGLMATVKRNADRGADNFRYFEIDRVFQQTQEGGEGRWTVGAVIGGDATEVDWTAGRSKLTFFHLKGVLENLLEIMGASQVEFRPLNHSDFEQGQAAQVVVNGKSIGVLGAIARSILAPQKIHEAIHAFEIDIEGLVAASTVVAKYQEMSRMPAVTRDLAVVVDAGVAYSLLERTIREAALEKIDELIRNWGAGDGAGLEQEHAAEVLELVKCVDVYYGKHIPEGKRSIAVRLRFRARGRTLSAEDVAVIMEYITNRLRERFNAKIRD